MRVRLHWGGILCDVKFDVDLSLRIILSKKVYAHTPVIKKKQSMKLSGVEPGVGRGGHGRVPNVTIFCFHLTPSYIKCRFQSLKTFFYALLTNVKQIKNYYLLIIKVLKKQLKLCWIQDTELSLSLFSLRLFGLTRNDIYNFRIVSR